MRAPRTKPRLHLLPILKNSLHWESPRPAMLLLLYKSPWRDSIPCNCSAELIIAAESASFNDSKLFSCLVICVCCACADWELVKSRYVYIDWVVVWLISFAKDNNLWFVVVYWDWDWDVSAYGFDFERTQDTFFRRSSLLKLVPLTVFLYIVEHKSLTPRIKNSWEYTPKSPAPLSLILLKP